MRPRKKIASEEGHRLYQAVKEENREQPKQRLLCVYLALHIGMPTPDVAKRVGFSEGTVRNLCSSYHRAGIEAFRGKAKGGRHHEYLSPEREWEFLSEISALAKARRRPLPVKVIKKLYEKLIRRRVAFSTVCRLFKRHNVSPKPNAPPDESLWALADDDYMVWLKGEPPEVAGR